MPTPDRCQVVIAQFARLKTHDAAWWLHHVPSVFNWGLLVLLATLILSQFLGVIWSTSSLSETLYYGVDPSQGPLPLGGFNDEPYADRSIVCLTQGRAFVPMQLSHALSDDKLARVVDTTGSAIDGFRVVERDATMTLQPAVAAVYARICDRIDYTLDAIQSSCDAVGFNVTRDALRIVSGATSRTTYALPKMLPVLIVPYWDNAVHTSYAIPATDGSVCLFRLDGTYTDPSVAFGVFRSVPKAVRHAKTAQWLSKPRGQWRNGWYETLEDDGQRWFANMMTTQTGGAYGLAIRAFDTTTKESVTCAPATSVAATNADPRCKPTTSVQTWGKLTTTLALVREDGIFVTNGTRFGLFLFDATTRKTTTLVYSLETFISNMSVLMILYRWLVALGAMLRTFGVGATLWQTTGIGAVSSSRTFNVLPVVLLPKLKLTLCAFFTAGCCFVDGDQLAFASAWYVIYPGIIEFLLFFYSILNTVARLTYRRMSDALFGPTLVCLCLLHYWRLEIARTTWLGVSDRVSTVISSAEVDALSLPDFLTTNAALRINGNAPHIFYFKLALLLLNLVPLVRAETMTEARGVKLRALASCTIEDVLALRASNLGGLGRSPIYANRLVRTSKVVVASASKVHGPQNGDLAPVGLPMNTEPAPITDALQATTTQTLTRGHVLIGYEMSRLGFLVYGDQFLLSFADWNILTSMAPLRSVEKLWNHRVLVFAVARDADGSYRIVGPPRLCRVDDPVIRAIPFYHVTVGAFQ